MNVGFLTTKTAKGTKEVPLEKQEIFVIFVTFVVKSKSGFEHPPQRRTMTRCEELEAMFNEGAPIAKTFGMRLSFDAEDHAVLTLPYNPGLDHALRGIHGGVYMTLLDTAAWFTVAVARDAQCWITTGEMSVHFLKASRGADLRCVGGLLKAGKRQDIAEARLYGADGDLVGHAVGTFMVLPSVPMKGEG